MWIAWCCVCIFHVFAMSIPDIWYVAILQQSCVQHKVLNLFFYEHGVVRIHYWSIILIFDCMIENVLTVSNWLETFICFMWWHFAHVMMLNFCLPSILKRRKHMYINTCKTHCTNTFEQFTLVKTVGINEHMWSTFSTISLLKEVLKCKVWSKIWLERVVLVIPMPGKKRFRNAIPACVLRRKTSWTVFWHVPSQKYP
jgi:hypothetical protein